MGKLRFLLAALLAGAAGCSHIVDLRDKCSPPSCLDAETIYECGPVKGSGDRMHGVVCGDGEVCSEASGVGECVPR